LLLLLAGALFRRTHQQRPEQHFVHAEACS